jgi:hypothetical protein
VDGDRPATSPQSSPRSTAVERRPIGWWLKEADAALEGAFDAAVGAAGIHRRGWQILSTLAAGPTTRQHLADELARFDPAAVVGTVIDDLVARGWVVEGEPISLTDEGHVAAADLATRVGEIRGRVGAALPDGDYDTLVHLLGRLVAAIR